MPSPDDFREGATNLWTALDSLYAKDPKEYKSLISTLQKSATAEGINPLNPLAPTRAVRPGWCLTTTDGKSTHKINLAQTDRISEPRKDGAVTVVLGGRRRGGDDGGRYTVYDTVVHPSIIDEAEQSPAFLEQLVELAIGCVEESFDVRLSRHGIKREKNIYADPYGWHTSGRPLEEGEVESSPFTDTDDPLSGVGGMTTAGLISHIQREQHSVDDAGGSGRGVKEEGKLPTLLPTKLEKKKGNIIQELPHYIPRQSKDMTPTLEALAASLDNTIDPGTQKLLRHLVEPTWKAGSVDGVWVLEVLLPGMKSAREIHVCQTCTTLEIITLHHKLSHKLPHTTTDTPNITCKLFLKSHILQISFPL
ncbi:uncharacterized protein EV422DRAFT_1869 [Fimicolochytrium jonesii]|uniref:uncharacterized protein n=1 Tax=Fimicolochytrium jonesii TaxID=1396493 RepID=UPI0022FEAC59|nr:uncharacterized protein EV422DRAFT_1869 [Fimicolochytrium jonesii]KAI8826567.1 hypothetical protein EV422DRAFT_1869 [Fimicolochytrium jonesii]